ncbi:MAG: hypothetical protein AAB268_12180, partial [Elusimicrobiota bacterium]
MLDDYVMNAQQTCRTLLAEDPVFIRATNSHLDAWLAPSVDTPIHIHSHDAPRAETIESPQAGTTKDNGPSHSLSEELARLTKL